MVALTESFPFVYMQRPDQTMRNVGAFAERLVSHSGIRDLKALAREFRAEESLMTKSRRTIARIPAPSYGSDTTPLKLPVKATGVPGIGVHVPAALLQEIELVLREMPCWQDHHLEGLLEAVDHAIL